jgi:hypothetical protein
MCGVQVVEEREDKFEVDPDWVMPQLMGLVPDGGRLDQEVLRLDNTYFDAFNTSTSASVWADPKCSMSRDPRRDFHTRRSPHRPHIRHGHTLQDPPLVHNFRARKPRIT